MSLSFSTPKKQLTWLITGCSSGFGLSLTQIAQASGHTVIATSRNPSDTPELVTEVQSRGGRWLQLDVDSPDSNKFVDSLEESGQEIDILVNNAGFCIFTPIETSTEEEHRSQMESMYFGPLRLIQAVVPYMRKRRFGVIVNLSSGASLDGNPTMGGYAGAKAALDGMTRVLAKEVAPFNIRALTVILGTYNTNFGVAAKFGTNPSPDDYAGTMVEKMIQVIQSGKLKPNGDKDKAMKAVCEVVVGEGAGTGHEAERFLPLGSDMTTRVEFVVNSLTSSLEAFKGVTNNVTLDD